MEKSSVKELVHRGPACIEDLLAPRTPLASRTRLHRGPSLRDSSVPFSVTQLLLSEYLKEKDFKRNEEDLPEDLSPAAQTRKAVFERIKPEEREIINYYDFCIPIAEGSSSGRHNCCIDDKEQQHFFKTLQLIEKRNLTSRQLMHQILVLYDAEHQRQTRPAWWSMLLCRRHLRHLAEERPGIGITRLENVLLSGEKSVAQVVTFAAQADLDKDAIGHFLGEAGNQDKTWQELLDEGLYDDFDVNEKDKFLFRAKAIMNPTMAVFFLPGFSNTLLRWLKKANDVVKECFGFPLRQAQALTFLHMVTKEERRPALVKGNLFEIATGEGKSIIVAVLASYMACECSLRVDIMTSSKELAKRESKDFEKFYDKFNLTCVSVCDDTTQSRKKIAYAANICYGAPGDYIFDVLRDESKKAVDKMRHGRPFSFLIIDEVDQVIIDDFSYDYRISRNVLGMNHIGALLALIWAKVRMYRATRLKMAGLESLQRVMCGNLTSIWLAVLEGIDTEQCAIQDHGDIVNYVASLGLIQLPENNDSQEKAKENEKGMKNFVIYEHNLRNQMTREKSLQFVNALNISKHELLGPFHLNLFEDRSAFPTPKDKSEVLLHIDDKGMACVVTKYRDFRTMIVNYVQDMVSFDAMPEKYKNGEENNSDLKLYLPSFLKPTFQSKLNSLVNSAMTASSCDEGIEYVVRDGKIVIVNCDTGVLHPCSRWSDGLHEFITMKHKLPRRPESLHHTGMKIWNYVLRYRGAVCGVTGTLAVKSDGQMMKNIFKMDLWRVPTFRPVLRREILPVMAANEDEWLAQIARKIKEVVQDGRASLIVAETISKCQTIKQHLEKELRGLKSLEIKSYFLNDMEDHQQSVEGTIRVGTVVIASNLGGRGTDFVLQDDVTQAGGLHVVLTFFPRNDRIEQQAFGRCGRKGQPGTCQLILNVSHLAPAFRNKDIFGMRYVRKVDFLSTLSTKSEEVDQANKQRDMFDHYNKILNEETALSGSRKDLVSQQFSLWCQNHHKDIKKSTLAELKTKLQELLRQCVEGVKVDGFSVSPYHVMAFEDGEKLQTLERAIAADPNWAAIPYMNKAYLLVRKGYLKTAKGLLEKADKSLDMYLQEVNYDKEILTCLGYLVNAEDGQPTVEAKRIAAKFSVLAELKANVAQNIEELERIIKENLNAKVKLTAIGKLKGVDKTEAAQKELAMWYSLGLKKTFKVEEKKSFCWDGLWCTLLGMAQVVGGIALIVGSAGALATIGGHLISEGVSDCIAGIRGMITGTFSWVAWLIGKAISIACAVVMCGIGKLAKYGNHSYKAALAKADSCISEGKQFIKGLGKTMRGKAAQEVAKAAAKIVVHEAATQVMTTGVILLADEAFHYVMSNVKAKVKAKLREKFGESLWKGKLNKSGYAEYVVEKVQTGRLGGQCYQIAYNEGTEAFDELCQSWELCLEISSKIITLSENCRRHVEQHSKAKKFFDIACNTATVMSISTALWKSFTVVVPVEDKLAQRQKAEKKEEEQQPELDEETKALVIDHLIDGCSDSVLDGVMRLVETGVVSHVKAALTTTVNLKVRGMLRKRFGTDNVYDQLHAFAKRHEASNGELPSSTSAASSAQNGFRTVSSEEDYDNWAHDISQSDKPGGVSEIRLFSEATGRPVVIHTMDNQGNLSYHSTVGADSKGEPIKVAFTPGKDGAPGHYAPVDKNGKPTTVFSSLSSLNGCLYDALACAHFGTDSRNANKVAEHSTKIKDMLGKEARENPAKYRPIFEAKVEAERLTSKHASSAFMTGGLRSARKGKDPNSKTWESRNKRHKKAMDALDSLPPNAKEDVMEEYGSIDPYIVQKGKLAELKKLYPDSVGMKTSRSGELRFEMDHAVPHDSIKQVEEYYRVNPKAEKSDTYKAMLDEWGVQGRVARELNKGADPSKLPPSNDRINMDYVDAFFTLGPAHREQMTSGGGKRQDQLRRNIANDIINDDARRLARNLSDGVCPDIRSKLSNLEKGCPRSSNASGMNQHYTSDGKDLRQRTMTGVSALGEKFEKMGIFTKKTLKVLHGGDVTKAKNEVITSMGASGYCRDNPTPTHLDESSSSFNESWDEGRRQKHNVSLILKNLKQRSTRSESSTREKRTGKDPATPRNLGAKGAAKKWRESSEMDAGRKRMKAAKENLERSFGENKREE